MRKDQAKYAFAVYQNIVQEVYTIEHWLPQNSTLNTKSYEEVADHGINTKKWEFVGNIAPKDIRDRYLYKNIAEYIKGNQNPVTYIDC